MALAEKEGSAVPLMIGHRLYGGGLTFTGKVAEGRPHFDRAIALYEPSEHRQLAMRFGQDARVSVLSFRSLALWMLGYPDAALADTHKLLSEAREIDHAATLMFASVYASIIHIHCGNYEAANTQLDEVVALAEKKGALFWKTLGMIWRGWLFALTGKVSDAVQMISSGITALRSTGSTLLMPLYLAYLARAHAEFGQFDDARRCIGEALTTIEATKERWWEADINCTAGEIALLEPERDVAKAQAYFERALAVARQQQAKSWELRAATSLARLWRDQGKVQQARELLAPVYGWFTKGFDTRDLKEAKALLEELAA
jgi:predicted ATPase